MLRFQVFRGISFISFRLRFVKYINFPITVLLLIKCLRVAEDLAWSLVASISGIID